MNENFSVGLPVGVEILDGCVLVPSVYGFDRVEFGKRAVTKTSYRTIFEDQTSTTVRPSVPRSITLNKNFIFLASYPSKSLFCLPAYNPQTTPKTFTQKFDQIYQNKNLNSTQNLAKFLTPSEYSEDRVSKLGQGFVIKKNKFYQGVYELPELKENVKREKRRLQIIQDMHNGPKWPKNRN